MNAKFVGANAITNFMGSSAAEVCENQNCSLIKFKKVAKIFSFVPLFDQNYTNVLWVAAVIVALWMEAAIVPMAIMVKREKFFYVGINGRVKGGPEIRYFSSAPIRNSFEIQKIKNFY